MRLILLLSAVLALCGCDEEHMKAARIASEAAPKTNAAPRTGFIYIHEWPPTKQPVKVPARRQMVVKQLDGNSIYLYCGSDDALAWAQVNVDYFMGHSATNLDHCNEAPFESYMSVKPAYDAQDVVGRLLDFPWNRSWWLGIPKREAIK